MHRVTGPTKEDAAAMLDKAIQVHVAIAFSHGCRIAVRVPSSGGVEDDWFYFYEFVVLSPGEFPPPDQGWTLYEDRSGIAVGRSIL